MKIPHPTGRRLIWRLMWGADKVFASGNAKVNFIKESISHIRANNATDYERLVLMMTALHMDAQQYVDVIANLPDRRLNTVNAQAFALLAYDSGNYTPAFRCGKHKGKSCRIPACEQECGRRMVVSAGRIGSGHDGNRPSRSPRIRTKWRLRPQLQMRSTIYLRPSLQTADIHTARKNSNDAAMVVIALTSSGSMQIRTAGL